MVFKPAEKPTDEQTCALLGTTRDGIAAIAGILRESYLPEVRAVFVLQLINAAEKPGDMVSVKAKVKQMLSKDDDK